MKHCEVSNQRPRTAQARSRQRFAQTGHRHCLFLMVSATSMDCGPRATTTMSAGELASATVGPSELQNPRMRTSGNLLLRCPAHGVVLGAQAVGVKPRNPATKVSGEQSNGFKSGG